MRTGFNLYNNFVNLVAPRKDIIIELGCKRIYEIGKEENIEDHINDEHANAIKEIITAIVNRTCSVLKLAGYIGEDFADNLEKIE